MLKIFKKLSYLLFLCLPLVMGSGCVASSTIQEKAVRTMPKNTIQIDRFLFQPNELVVPVNTTVIWEQNDAVVHTVVSPKQFESAVLQKGDTFTFTFTTPGEYAYYCSVHPSMKGKIIVR